MITYIGKKQVHAAVDAVCTVATLIAKFCKKNALPLIVAGFSFAAVKYFVPDSNAIREEIGTNNDI